MEPSDARVVTGKRLRLFLNIKNSSKAQIVELSTNKIHKINIIKNIYEYTVDIYPKNSGSIRIEAYNTSGWEVKNFNCTVLEEGYYSYPDLTIESISATNSRGGKILKAEKPFNLGVTILNKGADIPRGSLIRVVRDKVYIANPRVREEFIQDDFEGLKSGKTTFFNFILIYGKGKSKILIEVDPKKYLKDRDRSNNSKVITIDVQ
jgi:hypothetical protein